MYFTTAVNSVAMRTGFGPFQQRNFATITTVDDAWAVRPRWCKRCRGSRARDGRTPQWMDGPLRRLLLFEDRSASRFEAPITPPDDERRVPLPPRALRQQRLTNAVVLQSASALRRDHGPRAPAPVPCHQLLLQAQHLPPRRV